MPEGSFYPFVLALGDQEIRFETRAEFWFYLHGKITPSLERTNQLLYWSEERFRKEMKKAQRLREVLSALLDSSQHNSTDMIAGLSKLDPRLFSKEHGWRDVIAVLLASRHGDFAQKGELLRIVMSAYVRYLRARCRLMRKIYLFLKEFSILVVPGVARGDSSGENAHASNVSDMEISISRSGSGDNFKRLPKGEPIEIKINPDMEIPVLLSRYSCRLTAKKGLFFVDHEGVSYPLKSGRNVIGRGHDSDLVLRHNMRYASRQHLVIDAKKIGETVKKMAITDLSLHGTFLPVRLLLSAARH